MLSNRVKHRATTSFSWYGSRFSQLFRSGGSNQQAFWKSQPMRLYRLDLNFITSQIMNSLCTEYQHQSVCRKRSSMPCCCRLSLLKIQIHASRCLGLFVYIHRLRLQFVMTNWTGGSNLELIGMYSRLLFEPCHIHSEYTTSNRHLMLFYAIHSIVWWISTDRSKK